MVTTSYQPRNIRSKQDVNQPRQRVCCAGLNHISTQEKVVSVEAVDANLAEIPVRLDGVAGDVGD